MSHHPLVNYFLIHCQSQLHLTFSKSSTLNNTYLDDFLEKHFFSACSIRHRQLSHVQFLSRSPFSLSLVHSSTETRHQLDEHNMLILFRNGIITQISHTFHFFPLCYWLSRSLTSVFSFLFFFLPYFTIHRNSARPCTEWALLLICCEWQARRRKKN